MQPVRSATGYGTCLAGLLVTSGAAAADRPAMSDWDRDLCITAQRILVNAPDIPVSVQYGEGNGFYTIQMDIDAEAGELVVAMTRVEVAAGDEVYPGWVACKMVDQARTSDVLGLDLPGPAGSCRDVNERTLALALSMLPEDRRRDLEASGLLPRLLEDAVLPTGGEWLPALASDYVSRDGEGRWNLQAPAVRVPWNPAEREFFQGTHHCKLLTLAAARTWLDRVSTDPTAMLLPPPADGCAAPGPLASRTGSCLFYFAPVDAMVCQDYAGSGWDRQRALQECGQRHGSREALLAAGGRYEGSGGRWAEASCEGREDAPVRAGTCVFQCGAPDQTLWHLPAGSDALPTGACDLYLPAR